MDKKYMYLFGGVLVGVVFAGQIRALPLLNKLPTL